MDDWLKVRAYVDRKIKQISQERNRWWKLLNT
jgi:hypothetical protein